MTEFFKWLENGKPEVGQGSEYEEYARIWDASRQDLPGPPQKEEMWLAIRQGMAERELAEEFSWWKRFFTPPVLAFATVLVVFVGVWLAFGNRATFQASRGTRNMAVTLKDRSIVTLNAESKLVLDRDFNKVNRQVHFEGEAFFDIEKGAEPFVIKADDRAAIRVVGTRFNVYARDGRVRVDVTEGVVQLWSLSRGEEHAVTLRAGESSTVRNNQAPMAPVGLEYGIDTPAWMDGNIHCDETPLPLVCQEIERRFNVKIRVTNHQLTQETIDGLLKAEDLKTALSSLCVMVDASYSQEDGVYIIK